MKFDSRELSVLRAVIEQGSVTAAAATLNVSQPAVSRTLQQIEERVGIVLLRREKQSLHPTRETELLYPDVVQAVSSIEAVARRARDLREGRTGALRIATIAAFANSILPYAISRLRSRKPGVEFVVEILTARDVAQRVASFKSELGLLIDATAVSGILLEDLCTSRFGCVLPSDHALARNSTVTIEDLSRQPIICLDRMLPLGALAHRIFERADLQLRPAVEVSQSNIACVLVEAGAGIALIDKLGILGRSGSAKLTFVPLSPPATIVGRLALPVGTAQTASSREFCAALREVVAELAATDSGFSMRAQPSRDHS